MSPYQQKWIEVLQHARIPGWEIKPKEEEIYVEMPNIADLKLIRDNLPQTLGLISLDIDQPKQRLKFLFHNGHEHFEYILNPDTADLEKS